MNNQNNSLRFKELLQPAVVISFLKHKPVTLLYVLVPPKGLCTFPPEESLQGHTPLQDGASSCGLAREEGVEQGCQAPFSQARAEVLHVFRYNNSRPSCQTWTMLARRESREWRAHRGMCVRALWGLLKPQTSSEQMKRVPFLSEQVTSADAFGWMRFCWTLRGPKLHSGDLSNVTAPSQEWAFCES